MSMPVGPSSIPPATPPRTPRRKQSSASERTTGADDSVGSSAQRMNPASGGSNTPTPSKLRRKVTVEDSFENVVSVQRLVEYFVIVSCLPRKEVNPNRTRPTSPSTPASPRPRKPEVSREHGPILSSESGSADSSSMPNRMLSKKKGGKAIGKRDGSEKELRTSKSQDSHQDESREEIVPPPKPQGTWKRDEEYTEGNIHHPETNEYDELIFQPKITGRYPFADHPDNPLNPMVTQFCHPVGDVIVPTREYQMPRVHHFVLTNDKGRKIYGTCLTVFEEYVPPSDAPVRAHQIHDDSGERDIEVTMSEEDTTLYLPRCLCIMSIWPYMSAFREYLAQLYRLATSTNCMTVPLERYIMNICTEIPAPPPGAFEVQINILESVIRFWSPPANLPIAYVSIPYKVLFDCLDIDNILHLWYCLIMEQKVLLVSSQYSNLTVCAEILCSLLYPMKWSHLYVPILPRLLCPMLDAPGTSKFGVVEAINSAAIVAHCQLLIRCCLALFYVSRPVPYLCGVTRDNWLYVQQFVSDETIVVDLDRNNIMFGQNTPELPALPGKKWNKLRHSLEDFVGHLFWRARGLEEEYQHLRQDRISRTEFKTIARQRGETQWNEKLVQRDQAFNLQFTPDSKNLDYTFSEDEQHQWDRVQEAFLRFFVAVLKDYRRFLDTSGDISSQNTAPNASDWLQRTQQRSFHRDSFIRSQKSENVPFLQQLTMTQQFDDFITKRLYSPKMPDIIFFDQSIDAKLNRSRLKLQKVHTPFLQSAKAHKVLQKLKAVAPLEMETDEDGPYIYPSWPETLNPKLFGTPRPIPSMITAEFDRQAALISRLRATYSPAPMDALQLINFYGVDYDFSAEGMTFTLFFFVYSTVIGREWQAYQRKQRELDSQAMFGDKVCDEIEGETSRNGDGSADEKIEVEISDPDASVPGSYLGLCDGCPKVSTAIDDVLVYVTASPCSRGMGEGKTAHDMISEFTNTKLAYNNGRALSLVDDEQGFAEYEEAHDVAVAQLDLAFDALRTMALRGLLSDSDIFKSLMAACGRCGNTARAIELIQIMQRDGLVADREVLSCFITAFAHNEEPPSDPGSGSDFSKGRSSDAYSAFLKKNLPTAAPEGSLLPTESEDAESRNSDCVSVSSGSEVTVVPVQEKPNGGFLEWLLPRDKKDQPARRKFHRKRKQRGQSKPLPHRLLTQLVLGESLLEFLYPDLTIDTGCDSCPQCSSSMKESDIVSGWKPRAFQDFTTGCPNCGHRFVPRFTVSCSAPTFVGSQGVGTPLYCEFLSPWVLRKEIGHVIDENNGADLLIDPEWRRGTQVSSTLWWNLIVVFRHYELPFSFLLQGSFVNRLISPVPQDD